MQADAQKTAGLFTKITKNVRLLFVFACLAVILVIVIAAAMIAGGAPHRTESYKDVAGAAGLEATISYDCKDACNQKFNFNVYLFREDGQQVAVVRPDQEGVVRAAVPEGDYVMLLSKRFGHDSVFPQEPLSLKNGKMLELKLDY